MLVGSGQSLSGSAATASHPIWTAVASEAGDGPDPSPLILRAPRISEQHIYVNQHNQQPRHTCPRP